MKKYSVVLFVTLVVGVAVLNCGSLQVRKPEKKAIEIGEKKILIILVDKAVLSTDVTNAPAGVAAKASLLKDFNTALIIPTLPSELENLPKTISDASLSRELSEEGSSTKDLLDGVTAGFLQKSLSLASALGAYDTVLFLYVESEERSPLGAVGNFLPFIPKVTYVTITGSLYDAKTEKIFGAAKKESKMAKQSLLAQYPVAFSDYSKYLLEGK